MIKNLWLVYQWLNYSSPDKLFNGRLLTVDVFFEHYPGLQQQNLYVHVQTMLHDKEYILHWRV